MLGKEQPAGIEMLVDRTQFVAEQAALEQLLAEPKRDGMPERGEAVRRKRKISLKQPLELEKRLVVKGYVIDVAENRAAFCQTVTQRIYWKPRIVLLAREPLFLGGRNDAAVLNQGGGAVLIKGRKAQDPHQKSV